MKWLIHNSRWSLWDKPAGAAVTNASDKFESGMRGKMRGWTDIVPLFGSGENFFDRLSSVRISGKQEIVVNKNSNRHAWRQKFKTSRQKSTDIETVKCYRNCKKEIKRPVGEQGWRSDESARLPPVWLAGSIPARCHMWVEFVVDSRPCSMGFSPCFPVFLPPQKPTSPNSNSTRITDPEENQPRLMWLPL